MTQIGLSTKQKQTHCQGTNLGLPRGRVWGVWSGSLGLADVSYYAMEGINNKFLLCSTENSIQCPMITHNGKEYFKKVYLYSLYMRVCVYIYIHIYRTESLLYKRN